MKKPELYLSDKKPNTGSIHLEISTKPNISIDLRAKQN